MIQRAAKAARWLVSLAIGRSPSDPPETYFRLRRFARSAGPNAGRYRFPWGEFEYLSIGNLLSQYSEIFVSRNYAFDCDAPSPVIIDCGGNVGLSAVWFKQNYPASKLTIYEADPDIAAVLRQNIGRLHLRDVDVVSAAVWTAPGELGFGRRGPNTGALSANADYRVPTIRLADKLPAQVDLLKMDIEGAEFDVLADLATSGALVRVKNLIVELHVSREHQSLLAETLRALRHQGMDFTIASARAKRGLGKCPLTAPFPRLVDGQFLADLYAWRA